MLFLVSYTLLSQSSLQVGGGLGAVSKGYNLTDTSPLYRDQSSKAKATLTKHISLRYNYSINKRFSLNLGVNFSDRSVEFDSLYYRDRRTTIFYLEEQIYFVDISLGASFEIYSDLRRRLEMGVFLSVLFPLYANGVE